MKQSFFLRIILALSFTLIVLAAPLTAMAQDPVELTFWHAMSGHRGEVLNSLIDAFNRQNPGIRVTPVQVKSRDARMGNAYHELYKSILENIARQTPPDMAQVYENWTVQLIEIGALTPVQDFVGKEIPDESINDLVPVFKEANTFSGKLWTLPFNKSVYVLYYNKDMFDKAGLQPPTTWAEFRAAAGKLTVSRDGQVQVYGVAFRPSVDVFGHYLYAYGGDFIVGNKAAFNTEVGVQDMQFWVDMVHKDKSALASFADDKEFIEGRSAMYMESTSRISGFKEKLKFNWGVALLPKGTTEKYQFAGTNIAVFSHLTPEKKAAAAKFANYLISKDVTTSFATQTGYLPVRQSAINNGAFQKMVREDPRYQVGVTALKSAVAQPKVAAWEMIRGIIDDAMYEAMSLRNSPTKALERAVELSNTLIEKLTGMR